MDIAMIDNQMLSMDELPRPYLDRGIYFGDGVYEVVRSYDGQIFALDEHLARFERSLREIQIFGVDIAALRQKICDAVDRSGYDNAKIYFHITRGSEKRDHLPNPQTQPNFLLTVNELKDDPESKEKGIAVCTHPDWRWKRCDIKSLNLLANVLARIEANKKGASEAILVGDDGTITEGAGSAFFAVDGNKKIVITRPLSYQILPSITRSIVLQVAERTGLSVVEKALTPVQAAQCDELFIAVTTKDIMPVTKFNDAVINEGHCGPLTRALIRQFQERVRELPKSAH